MTKPYFHVICLLLVFSQTALARETTGMGKIIYTQGHINPACRTVSHKENDTGIQRAFRISSVASDDDVGAAVMSALLANRDTTISYEPGETTGCGTEPKIIYITVY